MMLQPSASSVARRAVAFLLAAALTVALGCQKQPATDDPASNAVSLPAGNPSDPDFIYNQFVFVTWQTATHKVSRPGFVFRREGDTAYVVTLSGNEKSPSIDENYQLSTNVYGQRRDLPGKKLGTISGHWIFSAPAKDLPAPLPAKTPDTLKVGTELKLWGFYFEGVGGRTGFTRSKQTTKVEELLNTHDGKLLSIRIKRDETPTPGIAIATTADGQFVACVLSRLARERWETLPYNQVTHSDQFDLQPLELLAELSEPQIANIALAPIAGDVKQLEFEWAVVINDPFGVVQDVRLAVKSLDPSKSKRWKRSETPWLDLQKPVEPLPKATPIPLIVRDPSPAADKYFEHFLSAPPGSLRVGTWTIPNPGPLKQWLFEAQVSLADASGQWRLLREREIEFRGLPSTIPGIDGLPLDMPVPVVLPDGSQRITGERTRATRKSPDRQQFPQPTTEARAFETSSLGFPLLGLAIKPQPGSRRPLVAVTPDGQSAYLCAGNVLHKVDLEKQTTVAALQLEDQATGIAISKAGIVVSMLKPGAILLLDENLNVKRQNTFITPVALPAPAIAVAASPASTVGFVMTRHNAEGEQPGGQTLWILDLETGQVQHALKERFGNANGYKVWTVGSATPLFDDYTNASYLQMSADGKRLCIGGRQASLFRVENFDLDFLQAMPQWYSHTTLYTPDQRTIGQLAAKNQDLTITLYDAADRGQEISKLTGLDSKMRYGLLARDRLVIADREGKVTVRKLDGTAGGTVIIELDKFYPDITFITPLSSTRFLGHSESGTALCDLKIPGEN